MGYRSDVALELTKEKNDLFRALYAAKFPEDIAFLYEHVENENEDGTLYFWSCLKWYDSFPEVSFIQSFLDTINYEDYAFIRIGEEEDDNQHRGDGDIFGLFINRRIGWY
jgi:hypothetical protein